MRRPSRRAIRRRRLLELIVRGVARVRAQRRPYAQRWRAANARALAGSGPLWVVLGDSASQGLGARDFQWGWVGQLHHRFVVEGYPLRLVNLSVTGARIQDVLIEQVPKLDRLSDVVLVTVLIGANDMSPASRRPAAVAQYAALLERLPPGRAVVVGTLPRRNPEARAINALIEQAAAAGRVRVADLRTMSRWSVFGSLSEDFFHPNERG